MKQKKPNESVLKKCGIYEDVQKMTDENYGKETLAIYKHEYVDFSPTHAKEVVGAQTIGYDKYIRTQIQSIGKQRTWFKACHYGIIEKSEIVTKFKGKVKRKTNNRICFEYVYVYGEGQGGSIAGHEKNVWMKKAGFPGAKPGDCFEFDAETYVYISNEHGKILDYGLRNPRNVRRIEPSELRKPNLKASWNATDLPEQLECETCLFNEQCDGVNCLKP